MLDDLKFIHEKDPQDALGVAEKEWHQLTHDFGTTIPENQTVQNVVLAGMGGSALPGVFMASWPALSVPFEVVRNYEIPAYVGEQTLFIASSYSGNTEESLAALEAAEQAKAFVVVIAAKGKLHDIALEKKYPLFVIPEGVQPRMASFYFIGALTGILEQAKVTPNGSVAELAKVSEWLKAEVGKWRPDIASQNNLAKRTAQELMGRTVIVYSGPKLWPAANKWKICINENAKNLAWANQYPEFNHNEFISWSSHPVDKPFAVVELRSDLEHARVQKRFEVTERLLSGQRPSPIVVKPEGETVLKQLLWCTVLGDFVSIYLALLNGVNPTPVDLVEKLKAALNE